MLREFLTDHAERLLGSVQRIPLVLFRLSGLENIGGWPGKPPFQSLFEPQEAGEVGTRVWASATAREVLCSDAGDATPLKAAFRLAEHLGASERANVALVLEQERFARVAWVLLDP